MVYDYSRLWLICMFDISCGMSKNVHVVFLSKHHRQLIFNLRWCDRLDNIYHARCSIVNGSARTERYRY